VIKQDKNTGNLSIFLYRGYNRKRQFYLVVIKGKVYKKAFPHLLVRYAGSDMNEDER